MVGASYVGTREESLEYDFRSHKRNEQIQDKRGAIANR